MRVQEEPESDTDSPCLIILPENRIQVMDDEINPRVRAQLLGEDHKTAIVKVPGLGRVLEAARLSSSVASPLCVAGNSKGARFQQLKTF